MPRGRGQLLEPASAPQTPDSLPARWLSRTVLHFSLLFTLPRSLPTIPVGMLQATPCPCHTLLGCHTGWCRVAGVGKSGWGSQPFRGDTARAEGVGRLRVTLSPCPLAKGPPGIRDMAPRWTQVQGRCSCSVFVLPSWLFPPKCQLGNSESLFFGALTLPTLHFASPGGRLEPSQGDASGRGHSFCWFFGSDRFRCRAGLEQTGSIISILTNGHHRGGFSEDAEAP